MPCGVHCDSIEETVNRLLIGQKTGPSQIIPRGQALELIGDGQTELPALFCTDPQIQDF